MIQRKMQTTARDGVTIAFDVVGSGPAVLLHTGVGGDGSMWHQAGYVEELARRHRVTTIDHRGHGASDRPSSVADHDVDAYVADALAVMDALGEETFTWIGYSDGAALGVRAAATAPHRVGTLVTIGSLGGATRTMDERRGRAAAILATGMGALVDALRASEPGIPEWFVEQMRSTDPAMFALELEGWSAWAGPFADLPSVACPMLLIAGGSETANEAQVTADADEVVARAPSATAHVIPGVGHAGLFVDSERVLRLIAQHLAAASPPGVRRTASSDGVLRV